MSTTKTSKKREHWPRVRKIESRKKPWLVDGRIKGRGERYFYSTATDADTKADALRITRANGGTEAAGMSSRLRVEAIEAERMLAGTGTSLTAAVQYFLDHAKPTGGTKTVKELVSKFLKAKREAGLSDAYLTIQRYVLKNVFGGQFGERMIHDIGAAEIEEWINGKPWSLRTRRNYCQDISNLLSFAVKWKHAASDPMLQLEWPKVPEKRPGVLTVQQASALLAVCAQAEREMLAPVAIGLFAGLRTEELDNLDWGHIDLDENNIYVPAEIAKTSEGRDVEIHSTLRAWLLTIPNRTGKLAPAKSYDWRLSAKASAAGITEWPKNALRHSFASYHYAANSNAPLTAAMLGHHGTSTLVKNYKKRVKPSDAKRYWLLTPTEVRNLVKMPKAS